MTNISDDADNLEGLITHRADQAFAQWLFIRKNCIDKLLTDDEDLVALSHLLLREVPSSQQRNAQRVEVLLIDATKVSIESLVRADRRAAFDCEWKVVQLTTEWKLTNEANRLDTRQAADPRLQLLQEVRGLFGRVVFLSRE